jgi:hypothetical protein
VTSVKIGVEEDVLVLVLVLVLVVVVVKKKTIEDVAEKKKNLVITFNFRNTIARKFSGLQAAILKIRRAAVNNFVSAL